MKKEKEKKSTSENKEKINLKKITRYLRELSVVVAGVAITFIVSGWISRYNDRKELERDLSAVRTELEQNLENIQEAAAFYMETGNFARYLISDKPENLSPDSIDKYRNLGVVGNIYNLTYKSSAFDIFQKSGTMNRIKNKILLQSIMDSYGSLQEIKQTSDAYSARKLTEIYNAVMKNRQVRFELLEPGFSDLFYFFALYYSLDQQLLECSEQIEETLALF